MRSAEQVAANINTQVEAVVDARSPGRFEGTAPEPRPGLPSGHIPGSRNVPFSEVLTTDGRCNMFLVCLDAPELLQFTNCLDRSLVGSAGPCLTATCSHPHTALMLLSPKLCPWHSCRNAKR